MPSHWPTVPLLAALLLTSACLPAGPRQRPNSAAGSGGDAQDDDDVANDDDDLADDDDDATPPGQAGEGDVRLVAGTETDGRIEIFHDGVWGTVCDDSWDSADAAVVCNQLGLPTNFAEGIGNAAYGMGKDPIWMDNVDCDGSESSLASCDHNGWGDHNCGHGEDAGVSCQ